MSDPAIEATDKNLVLDHYRSPDHRSHLESPTLTQTLRSPQCGHQSRFDLRTDDQYSRGEAASSNPPSAVGKPSPSKTYWLRPTSVSLLAPSLPPETELIGRCY